jgi:hypothetical protein
MAISVTDCASLDRLLISCCISRGEKFGSSDQTSKDVQRSLEISVWIGSEVLRTKERPQARGSELAAKAKDRIVE